jgi:hypothetical protein
LAFSEWTPHFALKVMPELQSGFQDDEAQSAFL